MKLNPFYRSIPLIVLLLAASFSSHAQDLSLRFYPAMGHINLLAPDRIILGDFELRLTSTTKVTLLDNKPGEMADLKLGDFVGATLITINNRHMVDAIFILAEPKQ